jgi:hypothetical protein
MLPSVALLAGFGCGEIVRLASVLKLPLAATPIPAKQVSGRRKRSRPTPDAEPAATLGPLLFLAVPFVLVTIAWPVWEHRVFFFQWPAQLACRLTYSGNPFVEAPVISDYLHQHMADDDTLAVLGSEPEIPFYGRRHSATGYIYTYGLMEGQPLAETMQREMAAEIEASAPKYVVVVDSSCSWLYNPRSKFLLHDWANRYLREKYEVVGLVERPFGAEIIYRWSETGASETPLFPWLNAAGNQLVRIGWRGSLNGYQPNPGAECIVWICRRKEAPTEK